MSESVSFESLGDSIVGRLFLPESDTPVPAVVIIHGAIDRKENFYELAEFLRNSGIAALTIDMHGHGESGGARYHVRMSQWVPDIQCALDFLSHIDLIDCERLGAFGFSSGGSAILEASVIDPRLKCLVTLDATVRPIVSKLEQYAFSFLGWFGRKRRQRSGKDLYLPLYGVASQQALAFDSEISKQFLQDPYFIAGYKRYPVPGAVESLVINTLEKVDQIHVPVCVIHGEEDAIDNPESAQLLHSRLKTTKALHIVPESGHVGHLDRQKEKVKQITLGWFSEHI